MTTSCVVLLQLEMKHLLVVSLLACVLVVRAARTRREDKYTTQYDNVDVDAVLNNERILKNYVDCLLGKGTCTPDGKVLREKLPEALETGCVKCSKTQKEKFGKLIKFLKDNKPEYHKTLLEKYDPSGKYVKQFGDELRFD